MFESPVNNVYTIKKVTGFDLSTIWQMTFGYRGLPYPATWLETDIPGLSGARKGTKSENKLSRLGAPLYARSENGQLFFMPVWLNDILLPICTISGNSKKVIVETPLTGRRGTVKELIRCEDYQFRVQGICFGYNREFPEEKIQELKDLFEITRSVRIKSAFTDIFIKDGYVVVTDINFPDTKGVEHVKGFELSLVSDESFELTLE
jgi:hypothetical protein